MQPDGSGETFIADGRQPAWSPDGTMIAFVRGNDIWVMDAQGGGQLQLTSNGSGQFPFDTEPAWTPDGQSVVFRKVSCAGCTPPVFAVSRTGGNFAVLDP